MVDSSRSFSPNITQLYDISSVFSNCISEDLSMVYSTQKCGHTPARSRRPQSVRKGGWSVVDHIMIGVGAFPRRFPRDGHDTQ